MNLSTLGIYLIVLGTVALAGAILLATRKDTYDDKTKTIRKSFPIILPLAFVGFILFCVGYHNKSKQWDEAISDNWEFYCDGTAIDPTTVYMDDYYVEFDENSRKVLLTK